MKYAGAFRPISRLIPLLALLLFASAPARLFGQQGGHASLIPPANRKPAPSFDLMSDTGKKIPLSDYRGKVVLLNFWATDCGGCVLEIPSFIALQSAYRDKGFTAVGISMDVFYEDLKNADEAWSRVRPFAASHKMNYPILMGDQAVSNDYALKAYPATYLIDKSGRIAAQYVGELVNKDNAEANLKKLLSEHN
jgi:peroxiredoxin